MRFRSWLTHGCHFRIQHPVSRALPRGAVRGGSVSDLYGNVVLTFRHGEDLTGRIVYLQEDAVMVCPDMFDPAQTGKVDRGNVLSIEPSKVSPMPEGLLTLLSQEEVLDLLAYLVEGGRAETAPRAQSQ